MSLATRALGRTGLEVSALGFGAGPLGAGHLSEHDVDALVGAALDAGITVFDTAPSYGSSEERLGRALGARRDGVVLATKGGYGVSGVQDWTGEVIRLGIDAALARMRTDRLEVFLLHSCDAWTLQRDDIHHELVRAKEAGKLRAAGYSGENEALDAAIASGRFDVVECSVSPFDRASLDGAVARAAESGLGVLGKRTLGNGAWRHETPPDAGDVRIYWERLRTMALDPEPLGWLELAVRFATSAPGVSSALVGTSSREHLDAVVAAAARGPLDAAWSDRLRDAWYAHAHAHDWRGVV